MTSLLEPPISTRPHLLITVHGTPAGQGQISFLGKGRPAIHTNHATLKPWRRTIVEAATAAAETHVYLPPPNAKNCVTCGIAKPRHGASSHKFTAGKDAAKCHACGRERKRHGLLGGPLGLSLTVTVEQSMASAKRGDVWPDNNTTTDIDHHARAELDALTEAAVWHDDGQVAFLTVAKVFPTTPHPDALPKPGAVIRIWKLDGTGAGR
ncbi:RusA family crossover junction endodeoxyribonuclease [Kitasatospora sp. NBC_01302]|uniref:RusA family crossover junction endodeoxyribonuclease n=1 Tax=Kitasatospora sp. NBC_01302 TaxID=2903575 RepID=UPI002E0EBE4D|nr:RusA family crossover junction endodeoxyribonuclease [Kitasatospora sp. NBC_01302]